MSFTHDYDYDVLNTGGRDGVCEGDLNLSVDVGGKLPRLRECSQKPGKEARRLLEVLRKRRRGPRRTRQVHVLILFHPALVLNVICYLCFFLNVEGGGV